MRSWHLAGSRTAHGAVIILLLAVFGSADALAQCGDADGDGRIGLDDGIRVLRAFANLAGACPPRRCDVDAVTSTGGITLLDAIAVLRNVAGLLADPSGCRTPAVTEIVDQVQTGGPNGGTQAEMLPGKAPIPPPGAPATLQGSCDPSSACADPPDPVVANDFVTLPFGAIGGAALTLTGARIHPAGEEVFNCPGNSLIVAVPATTGRPGFCNSPSGVPCDDDADCNDFCASQKDGYFILPIGNCTEDEIRTAQTFIADQAPRDTPFFVDVATCCNDVLGAYARFKFQANN